MASTTIEPTTAHNEPVWGKSGIELEHYVAPHLGFEEFQSLCEDFIDRIFWDRLPDEEILDKLEFRAKHYHKTISRRRFQELITSRRTAHERAGIELPMPEMPDRENLPPYIIPRIDKNYAGWWPRGAVSLVAGSSGMGKTTMLMYLLEDLRAGKAIQNHPATTADYGLLLVDRTHKQLAETLEHKGLDSEEILRRAVEVSHEDGAAHKVLARQLRLWKRDGLCPDLVVLEGIDFWVRKIGDFDAVYRFVKSLEPVAEAWGVAVVATIGCPKMKAKDAFLLTRDNVLGTSAWSRTCSTIQYISQAKDEDDESDNPVRFVKILPRTGRTERLYFYFDDGRALFSATPPEAEGLAGLNLRAEQDKLLAQRNVELAAMREIIGRMQLGIRFQTGLFDFIKKPSVRAQRLRELASEGLVVKKGIHWHKAGG